MRLRTWCRLFILGFTFSGQDLHAGGSGLNVLVVVNPNSPNSLELGNYYCERRQVPPQNVVRLRNWTGGDLAWSRGQLQASLLNPLFEALSERNLSRQIDFVLLSIDIPYEVTEAGSINSTTSVLFYGFKPNTTPPGPAPPSCYFSPASSNSYAFSEAGFRDAPPDTAPTHSFLTTMLTADNLAQAKFTVDQGVASDGAFPTQTVYLAQTTDGTRTVRFVLFDDAIFDTRVQGNYSLVRTNQDSPYGLTNLLGYQTGLYGFSILPNAFVPGAMADSLTSFGGVILQPNGQSTVLDFLSAGASGSYGTVVEPCNWLEKFPSPRNYFYQARGFSLAECYYQSLLHPFQGLLVGEPLAAPFARRGTGSWSGLSPGARLSGTTNLALRFTASDSTRPLQRVDLFVDGTFLQTVTNIPPAEGNLLSVTCDGFAANYVVPSNATLQSITAGLADQINAGPNITASASGDRVALRSTDSSKSGDQLPITASTFGGTTVPTTFVRASRSRFLDTQPGSNPADLPPRNHLYVTAGVTNLAVTFSLDTTALADGHHELTVVAYEGSHVRTQTPVTQTVIVSNTPLSAALVTLDATTNLAVEATVGFSITANTNAISSIELLSTGGSLGVVTNQASATFSSVGTKLGAGLHPFYAIVTAISGAQYRTETKWTRLVNAEPPFSLAITGSPPLLSWPALSGRRYDILSADDFTQNFQLRQTVLPTNGIGYWLDDLPSVSNRFYRVRSAP